MKKINFEMWFYHEVTAENEEKAREASLSYALSIKDYVDSKVIPSNNIYTDEVTEEQVYDDNTKLYSVVVVFSFLLDVRIDCLDIDIPRLCESIDNISEDENNPINKKIYYDIF